MARYVRPSIKIDADIVWASAAAAQRINRSYIKTIPLDENFNPVEGVETNRQLMLKRIHNQSLLTDEDRAEGEKTRAYFKGLTFKILSGIQLSEFDNASMVIANRDVITSSYDVAIICSLPSCYLRAKLRDEANARVRDANGGHVSVVGEKVALDIEVVKCIYSRNYNTYFITGLTDKNQAVFFSYKESIDPKTKIKVAGKVKAHRDDATQLNRVKVEVI